MQHTLRVFRDLNAVELLRPDWERLQRHPNSDLDHFLLICRLRAGGCQPYVIVADDGTGRPRTILAARLEDSEIAPSLGYLRPFRLGVKSLAVIHQGVLGDVDDSVALALLKGLCNAMSAGHADIVELFHVPDDSPLLRAALTGMPWLRRDGKPSWSTHWGLVLPREPGGLLKQMSSKHRSWIRRKIRDLDAAFPGRWQYSALSAGDDLEQLFRDLELVAQRTYQRSLGAGFVDDEEQRERFALFHRRNQLRAWTLRVDEIPRAYAVGIVYRDTFHFSATGYDPDFRRFELGTLVFHHMVDELTKEGVAQFDFGLGDAGYKQRFGDRSWREATLRLYNGSWKGLQARTVTGMVQGAEDAARYVARQLGAADRLKTAWRRWLTPARQPGRDGQ